MIIVTCVVNFISRKKMSIIELRNLSCLGLKWRFKQSVGLFHSRYSVQVQRKHDDAVIGAQRVCRDKEHITSWKVVKSNRENKVGPLAYITAQHLKWRQHAEILILILILLCCGWEETNQPLQIKNLSLLLDFFRQFWRFTHTISFFFFQDTTHADRIQG